MRGFWEKITARADLRFALHSGFRQFLLVLAVGLLAKFFVCDSLKIAGDQMEPAIMTDDRILLFKMPYKAPFTWFFPVRSIKKYDPVVALLPDESAATVLRIAAISGDTISINNAQFYRNKQPIEHFHQKTELYDAIPAAYSPADFMTAFKIPSPGDSIIFSELTLRDLIFAYSIFRQETNNTRLKPYILDGETASDDYIIEDFSLYGGSIDSVPEALHTDWFFWDRLQGYFDMTAADGKSLRLAFSVFKNDREVSGFKVKKRYVFLIGDNWGNAKDSRHFGPVITTNIQGRPIITLWGFDVAEEDGKKRVNGQRIGRVVK